MIRNGLQKRIKPYIISIFQPKHRTGFLTECKQIPPAEFVRIKPRGKIPHALLFIGEQNRREERGKRIDVPSSAVSRKNAGEEASALFQFRYFVPGDRNQLRSVIQRGEGGQDHQVCRIMFRHPFHADSRKPFFRPDRKFFRKTSAGKDADGPFPAGLEEGSLERNPDRTAVGDQLFQRSCRGHTGDSEFPAQLLVRRKFVRIDPGGNPVFQYCRNFFCLADFRHGRTP